VGGTLLSAAWDFDPDVGYSSAINRRGSLLLNVKVNLKINIQVKGVEQECPTRTI